MTRFGAGSVWCRVVGGYERDVRGTDTEPSCDGISPATIADWNLDARCRVRAWHRRVVSAPCAARFSSRGQHTRPAAHAQPIFLKPLSSAATSASMSDSVIGVESMPVHVPTMRNPSAKRCSSMAFNRLFSSAVVYASR